MAKSSEAGSPISSICTHYGSCGGCTLSQDNETAVYHQSKQTEIEKTLRTQGLPHKPDAFIHCASASRRRVTLSFARAQGQLLLGFHGQRSHDIVPVTECLVAKTQIVGALPALRIMLEHVTPKMQEGKVTLLASDSGLDISLEDIAPPNGAQRSFLIETAKHMDAARLSANSEIIAQFRAPQLRMGKAYVTPPPGGFVQSVEEAEIALGDFTLSALRKYKCKSAADLFSGCGAFTFRIAEHCRVHAVESQAAAVEALQQAARHTQGLKPVTAEKRDLFRRPLLPHELKNFGAVVLDPPWQGAAAQITQLAKSTVPIIVYISCNPGTFARDATGLTEAGYEIQNLLAVDQFLWSEHVELAGLFVKRKNI